MSCAVERFQNRESCFVLGSGPVKRSLCNKEHVNGFNPREISITTCVEITETIQSWGCGLTSHQNKSCGTTQGYLWEGNLSTAIKKKGGAPGGGSIPLN